MSTELPVSVDVDASADTVWSYVTDWERQGEWMLGTRVQVTGGDGGAGTTLRAVTGVGPLGLVDTMEVVEFRPPVDGRPGRAAVRHTGRVVRGEGFFEVQPLGPRRCRFTFTELLDVPGGAVGKVAWRLGSPAVRLGFVASLRQMARHCAEQDRREHERPGAD